MDRNPHIGRGKLGQDRAVYEFHQGMHNGLGMDEHVHLVRTEAEKPVRFDYLKAFVH